MISSIAFSSIPKASKTRRASSAEGYYALLALRREHRVAAGTKVSSAGHITVSVDATDEYCNRNVNHCFSVVG